MSAQLMDRQDLEFLLFDLLEADKLCERERYAEHSQDTFKAVLDTAERIAASKFAPHAHDADEHEPRFENGKVTMLPQVGEAIRAFADAGFLAAGHDDESGGMQLPVSVAQACMTLFRSANTPTSAYLFLTAANANLIRAHGSPAQKQRFLPALLAGRWLGTMALTEPHAGSSVPDARTTATPVGDGTYRIRGTKIFISGGDHELSENIVHLVLARLPDAPAGARGLSLFIVPKYRVDGEGRVGARNDVALAGLIHKMGYRGTTSTILSFGENDECLGELIGEPNRGLNCMFHMMNEARIGVGLGAAVIGYTGYRHALEYARTRPQGRHPDARDPASPQVSIIEHADVRRMLLTQKAYVEGGLALCLTGARLADDARTAADAAARSDADALLGLLTPVIKSWPSQFCLEANSLAIQVHGGYGYTREYPVERLYRDNRLNPLHEGTHGIQGMDLLGRKAGMDDGRAMRLLDTRIATAVANARASGDAALAQHADALAEEWQQVQQTTAVLLEHLATDRRAGLANASIYLEAFGRAIVAWIWLEQAVAALRARERQRRSADFVAGKLAACAWYYACELPRNAAQHELLRRMDEHALRMQPAWF
ncbi:acyl-CoA dehydrogenase [Verticiella sediminum]|nr:acyl-CoA dehydrogenase [Verticiella sediminum]